MVKKTKNPNKRFSTITKSLDKKHNFLITKLKENSKTNFVACKNLTKLT